MRAYKHHKLGGGAQFIGQLTDFTVGYLKPTEWADVVDIEDMEHCWPPKPMKLDSSGKKAVVFTEAIEAEKKRCEDAAKSKAEMIAKIKATLDECDKDKDENKKGLSYCVRALLLMLTEGNDE